MSNFFYFPLSDFFLRILSILTHTQEERRKCFKEIDSGVYSKEPNSWINTSLKIIIIIIIRLNGLTGLNQ